MKENCARDSTSFFLVVLNRSRGESISFFKEILYGCHPLHGARKKVEGVRKRTPFKMAAKKAKISLNFATILPRKQSP
jgi:hypothetical protein